MNESGSFVQVWMKSRAFCIDRVLVVCANRSGKIFFKVIASKAKTKQYFEAAKDLLCQPGWAEPTGKAFQRSLGWAFLCLLCKQFNHFSSVFWQMHLVPCCLQELWICYNTKRFSFCPTLMLLTVIALYSIYLFVWLKVKISQGKLRARIFSGGFLHMFKTSRDLCFK